MTEARPNPDQLLAEVQQTEQRETRGRLKIFFGAAPGVGKTFAMLEEGRRRASEGMDVLVGYAEPHARMDTEALLIGMDILPYRTFEYRGTELKEFDLDAALARRPHLILVDELAHTNAVGSRHAKRWQDVVELLDAGLNVYTTLNVQHLESVNDIVEHITGVKVRETLPDAVLERANEIELIDTAADELLDRFRKGKIYRPEQAERASRHFFTKGNLIALRELAMRRAADQVDAQMNDFRRENRIGKPWAVAERILVCVGPSPLSERLVRSAKRLASGLKAPLIAAYVERPGGISLSAEHQKRLDANLKLAEQLGAETITLIGTNIAEEITLLAYQRNVTKIVIGKPRRSRWLERFRASAVDDLIRRSGEIDVYVIRGDAESRPADNAPKPAAAKPDYAGIGMAGGVVGLAVLVGLILYNRLGLSNANVLMLFLLCVLWIASRRSRGAAIVTAVLGVLAFDFFFVPPEFSFSIQNREYGVTFFVMLLTAIFISTLTHRLRDQAMAARVRERRVAILYALTRDLSVSRSVIDVATAVARHVGESLNRQSAVLLGNGDGTLSPVAGAKFVLDAKALGTSQWTFDHQQLAGRGTMTLPQSSATYYPLVGGKGSLGVLAISAPLEAADLTIGQQQLAESIATQIGLAIDRIKLADEARVAWERVESELLRNTLLSGVSHELRTPLATIIGAIGTAIDPLSPVSVSAKNDLLDSSLQEAERMDRLITNLLDMTRLESGGLQLKRSWCSIADLIASATRCMARRLLGRRLEIQLPPDLPMIELDGVAMEQVIINLVENAIDYTPAATPITVSASALNEELRLDISDRGPGLPAGSEKRVFDKFFRGDPKSTRRGVGLGLAICRGIVTAHGGHIAAFNRSGGGATFSITLPYLPLPLSATAEIENAEHV